MARPRKSTKQEFYDTFADFDLAEQELVLDFLAEQHRQHKRWAAKQWRGPVAGALSEDPEEAR